MDSNELKPELRKSAPADYLNNERTFLSWIRTSIALMGFGFVVVKFALFIRQISLALGRDQLVKGRSYSAVIGVIMVALGALMAIFAYRRYRNIEKQLDNNAYMPSKWLSILITLCIIIASLLLILYLLPNINF